MPNNPSKRYITGEQMLTLAGEMNSKYDVSIKAGATGDTENAATTSGNTYINAVEGGVNKGGVHLVPGDNTSIVSDDLGNVTIQSTDTKYGLSLNGNTITLVERGPNDSVSIPALSVQLCYDTVGDVQYLSIEEED